jgi:hypothetical protein
MANQRTRWLRISRHPYTLVLLISASMLAFVLIPVYQEPQRRGRHGCFENVRQITLALLQYESQYKCFPPAYVTDKKGHPMHSWRTLILPYLGLDDLYEAYDFSEAWNGPHNSALVKRCPKVFQCPWGKNPISGATNYVAVVGSGTAWPGVESVGIDYIANHDGASNTLLVVEVGESDIPWTEPRDLTFGEATRGVNVNKKRGISSNHGVVYVGFADGHQVFLEDATSPAVLKAMLTTAGGEIIEENPDGSTTVKEAERQGTGKRAITDQ